jgi:tetratricopeptide (TPR) repeat protein
MVSKPSILLLLLVSCSPAQKQDQNAPVLTGLDGRPHHQPDRSAQAQHRLDSNLQVALKNFEADPSEENFSWLGRRQAYVYQYNEAIETFSAGLKKFPGSYKLFRHRGHRYITLRDFPKAIADLQMAATLMPRQPLEIEPDGQPNKLNRPLSNTQFNVWYHLGLAHYLSGDFESAEKAYVQCLDVSDNDDLVTATADWLYMTYRRMNKPEEAAKVLELIREDMTIIENDSYYLRLRMYKGLLPVDSVLKVNTAQEDADLALATQGYGVGNHFLCQGDTTRAVEIFQKVISGNHFAAFGFIAAEADLVRLVQ